MKMPNNIREDTYFIRVEGKLSTGEMTFANESIIIFEQKAVSIIIQLERPDYRHQSMLRFRCIAIYPDLSAYYGTMDVFVISPDGIILRRWENIQTQAGVISKEYEINDEPPPGKWQIKATVMGYEATKEFEVYEFYQWKYEVNVSMPHYFLTDSPGVSGVVVANYTTGRAVFGRCRIKAIVKRNNVPITDLEGYPYLEVFHENFEGVADFYFSMGELIAVSGETVLNELEVYVEAQVEDPYFGDFSNGSFITTLYDPRIKLKFLGKQPRAFKPKMPYTTFVSVSQQDGTPLPDYRLYNSYVRFRVEMNGGSSLANQTFIPIGSSSIVSFTFTPDSMTQFITVSASFVSNDYEDPQSVIYERAVRYKSQSNSYIHVTSSTINPQVGDYMIFTVKLSQPVDQVYYHIISSSRIIFTDVLNMNNKQKTFDVGLTREMAPSAHIVAYYIRYDGELVADSYNFHVNASSIQNKVNMTINKRKDFTGDTIEILAYASPQSFVGFAALDESIVRLYNGGNIITELMLYDELYSFDSNANTSFSQTWNTELGFASDRVFYPSQSYAYDALSTFSYTGLILFTDLPVVDTLTINNQCNESLGLNYCLDGYSCYRTIQKCDGVCHCQRDCADETNCPERVEFFRPLHERFLPKIERIYQLSWLWKDQFTLPDGRVQFVASVSKDIANYAVSAFACSLQSGFGILKLPGKIQATRQFYIQVEMPTECRLGEQIGIRVDAFNFQNNRIEALIILHPSKDYKFVNVDKDGLVSSFAPKITSGYHHVLLIIQAGKSRRIHIPIVPLRRGNIDVKIEAISGANRDSYQNKISVRHEGIMNTFHTPFLLSLVNMPRMISEFEIVTNETFLLPLQQIWQYIPGSPIAKVHITGDVCGPFFWLGYDQKPNTLDYLHKKSNALSESGIFNYGTLLYNMMYLRQGHGGRNFSRPNVLKIIDMLNYEMQRLLLNYDENGFFNHGIPNTESIWLTSWALTVFKESADPVWERLGLFIDPNFLNKTVVWLISQQNPINGSWSEPTGKIYDRKFVSNWTRDWDGRMVQLNLALTAQCLIALKVNSDVRGNAASITSNSINKARMYLEQHYTKITDAFERAIVTYALHVSNSPIKDIVFQIMNQTRNKNDYGIYWSNWELPRMRTYWPSKNPRHNWKPESNHEAHAVAATAYALLTHIMRAEQSNKYEIMTWLQTQRNFVAGMSSLYDTLMSHKALVLYAISTGDTIQNYNMNINFTSSSSNELEINYLTIDNDNIIELQEYDIQNVWGNLVVDGQGTGYALVQLSVTYNVEYPWQIRKAPYEAFNISLQTYLYGRNFSHIDYHVCLNWLPVNLEKLGSNRSGFVQFEIEIPTGYRIEERLLKSLIYEYQNLNDAENMPGPQINFLFDYIDVDPTCFKFTLIRYIPVANISRYYSMKAYEYHEPFNANRSMYTLRDIFALDICEVCGSYQCPYCPYYAFAIKTIRTNPILILVSILIVFVITIKANFIT
jgi:CD109 antigen